MRTHTVRRNDESISCFGFVFLSGFVIEFVFLKNKKMFLICLKNVGTSFALGEKYLFGRVFVQKCFEPILPMHLEKYW